MGEIKMVSFDYPAKGWALCNGQLMPINQNQVLFSLFGTMYGRDGRTNFGLPNLQGRTPLHVGSGYVQGQAGGEAGHTLTASEIPQHGHGLMAVNANSNNVNVPANAFLANSAPGQNYAPAGGSNLVNVSTSTVAMAGSSAPHNNMQPYRAVNFCVALQGIFPQRP